MQVTSVNLKPLELGSPAAMYAVLGSSKTDSPGSVTDALNSWLLTLKGLEGVRCWRSAAWRCNPSGEGQIGVTCDFQVSF